MSLLSFIPYTQLYPEIQSAKTTAQLYPSIEVTDEEMSPYSLGKVVLLRYPSA
jgi:hypothetical protein